MKYVLCVKLENGIKIYSFIFRPVVYFIIRPPRGFQADWIVTVLPRPTGPSAVTTDEWPSPFIYSPHSLDCYENWMCVKIITSNFLFVIFFLFFRCSWFWLLLLLLLGLCNGKVSLSKFVYFYFPLSSPTEYNQQPPAGFFFSSLDCCCFSSSFSYLLVTWFMFYTCPVYGFWHGVTHFNDWP